MGRATHFAKADYGHAAKNKYHKAVIDAVMKHSNKLVYDVNKFKEDVARDIKEAHTDHTRCAALTPYFFDMTLFNGVRQFGLSFNGGYVPVTLHLFAISYEI